MSSKIEVQRICQHCSKDFTARTTVTRYCSHKCANAASKRKVRTENIEASNKETIQAKIQPIEVLKAKEFLTIKEVSKLLNCSLRSAYYHVSNGTIKATNLNKRLTRVKRSEIDKLFEQPQPLKPEPEQKQFDIADCYNLTEIQSKYGISEKALQNLIKRNNIPKIKKGWFAYVPKTTIDKILS